jgi:FKBP-type peptidyl-prolyl cis-trans isomerase
LEGYGKNGDLKVPFWSTKDAGQKPFTFQIGMGNVIKGWDEGVAGMDLGETARVRSLLDVLMSGLFQTSLSPIAFWQLPILFNFRHLLLAANMHA